MTDPNDLVDASETDLGEQLDKLEAELARNPEPPHDEPGARFAWGEDVYLDALEGACFATELNRQESVTKLFRLVARGAEAVMTSNPTLKEGEEGEPDRSAANPFTYIQGVAAAIVIGEEGILAALGKVDPTANPPEDVPIGPVMLEFAVTARHLAAGDEAAARERLALIAKMPTEDMELEELYWFRVGALLDGVLSGEGDLPALATEVAYVHKAVYSGPDLEDDPGAYLALPLAATRVLGHQRSKPFEYPEELDQVTLEALLDEYEAGIDAETLALMIRAATETLLQEKTLEEAVEAVLVFADGDEELAGDLAADVRLALDLVGSDEEENDEETIEDLAIKLGEQGIPEDAAMLILQVIMEVLEAGEAEEEKAKGKGK